MNQNYNIPNMMPQDNMAYGYYLPTNVNYQNPKMKDERLAGGFVFPFLLGGVTGAALAPAFWRPPYNRPMPYPPYPPYPPRRWF